MNTQHANAIEFTLEPIVKSSDKEASSAVVNNGVSVQEIHKNRHEVKAAYHFMDSENNLALKAIESGIELMPKEEYLWLMQMDLLRITGDRSAFEQKSVKFAESFGISPPAWRDIEVVSMDVGATDVLVNILMMTKATSAEFSEKIRSANGGKVTINLGRVGSTDRDGLVDILAAIQDAEASGSKFVIQSGERLIKSMMENAKKVGESFREIWDLTFLLLKYAEMSEDFDIFALYYAEAFGQSPPDWDSFNSSAKADQPIKKKVGVQPIKGSVALSADLSQMGEADLAKILQMAVSGKLILDMRSCRKISYKTAYQLAVIFFDSKRPIILVGTNAIIKSAIECGGFHSLKNVIFNDTEQ